MSSCSGDDGLPANYQWFSNQIAGHHPSVIKNGKREIGLLQISGTSECLKPKQDASRGEKEVAIYKLMSSNNDELRNYSSEISSEFSTCEPSDVQQLRNLCPRFFGIRKLFVDGQDREFLILEDVTANYNLPAILDLKMGRKTYDPLASREKIDKESIKYPPQAKIGCRLLGYRIHSSDKTVKVRDKDWGKSFDENTIQNGLAEFFSARGPDSRSTVIREALNSLKSIRQFFETQKSFQFFASSLLFVYEARENLPTNLRIVMIDFSHAFNSNGERDEGYLFGVENLQKFLENLL
ncbi:unnamed protein product [Caenorhabditis angaria]|uniref:Kinase n=1 Tax=Caenorhabditis angaria TaxID=860376 RepID=A0A9P1N393_9PELO|nr:unnamed protein product [Caenorhabditis angaria]